MDGDLATAWSAPAHGGDWWAGAPFWLQVDLQNLYTPERILLSGHDSFYSENYYIEYVLEYSTDGTTWSLIQEGTLYDGPTAPLDYVDDITLTGTDVMRYVKFTVDGGTHWAHLNEMEVWSGAPIPEPAGLIIWSLLGIVGITCYWKRRSK